jgi:predicted DCC family thiol-disulfide oxidoreductase YuxK
MTENVIVYDGECPFCSQYVKMLRIRESVGGVRLIDARSSDEIAISARDKFDLDQGMAARISDEWYYGDDCVHILSMISSPVTTFNKLNGWIFRSPKRARVLYPVMKTGRNLALRLLGRRKIGQSLSET